MFLLSARQHQGAPYAGTACTGHIRALQLCRLPCFGEWLAMLRRRPSRASLTKRTSRWTSCWMRTALFRCLPACSLQQSQLSMPANCKHAIKCLPTCLPSANACDVPFMQQAPALLPAGSRCHCTHVVQRDADMHTDDSQGLEQPMKYFNFLACEALIAASDVPRLPVHACQPAAGAWCADKQQCRGQRPCHASHCPACWEAGSHAAVGWRYASCMPLQQVCLSACCRHAAEVSTPKKAAAVWAPGAQQDMTCTQRPMTMHWTTEVPQLPLS